MHPPLALQDENFSAHGFSWDAAVISDRLDVDCILRSPILSARREIFQRHELRIPVLGPGPLSDDRQHEEQIEIAIETCAKLRQKTCEGRDMHRPDFPEILPNEIAFLA